MIFESTLFKVFLNQAHHAGPFLKTEHQLQNFHFLTGLVLPKWQTEFCDTYRAFDSIHFLYGPFLETEGHKAFLNGI